MNKKQFINDVLTKLRKRGKDSIMSIRTKKHVIEYAFMKTEKIIFRVSVPEKQGIQEGCQRLGLSLTDALKTGFILLLKLTTNDDLLVAFPPELQSHAMLTIDRKMKR